MKSDFEERRARRRECAVKRAEKKEQEAVQHQTKSRRLAEMMQGQPIQIGHHSEKRHRRDIEKMHRGFRKANELEKSADHDRRIAAAIDDNYGISGDDPTAEARLKERIEELELEQEKMKRFNAAMKKDDLSAMRALGFSDALIYKLKTPDFAGRTGFPSYRLTNNGANIRRLKQRLETIAHAETQTHTETPFVRDGVTHATVIENVADNRLQIRFAQRLTKDQCRIVKSHGYRWSHHEQVWQRHLHTTGASHAVRTLEEVLYA